MRGIFFYELRVQNPGAVSLATIVRSLKTLTDLKLVQVLTFDPSEMHFEAATDGEFRHYAVCSNCETLTQLKDLEQSINELMKQIEVKYGFTIQSYQLQFFGLCSNCLVKKLLEKSL